MTPSNNIGGHQKGRAAYNELFSTAVLTSTIVKVFALTMIVSLVYRPRIWLEPGAWLVAGGVVVVLFGASYWLSLRLLHYGPGHTPSDLSYPVFSLLAVMLILLFVGPRMHYLNILFFFPVVIATLMLGRRGMTIVPAAIAFMLGVNLYYRKEMGEWCMADNVATSVVLVFIAWLVGEATELNRKINKELTDNTLLLNTVFDALPAGVLTMNRKGEILSVNRYLRALIGSGKQREEQTRDRVRDLFDGRETTLEMGELRDFNDRPVPVQVSRHPVTIRSGQADVVLIQNLTDRRKLRELDLMFRRLLAEWNLGAIFLDSHGRVRVHNEPAHRYLGLDADFRGKHLSDILPQLTREMPGVELVRDNRYLQVARSTWSETPDGMPWTVLTITDTTAQKKTELEMQRARNLSSLGQVAAGVAHELRNPLTTIKGFTQLAVEGLGPGKEKSHLVIVQEEIERMQEILDRFLLMAKPTKPCYARFDLCELVHWVWELIYNDSLARQITLVRELSDEPLPTWSDGQQMRQVVLNLVNNAFEATPAGGRVTLSCRAEGQNAVLAVRDTGCGIPPHLLDEVFVPFVTTKDSGTGLGLAISREIVHKHGGKMEVESSAGGTAIRVLLPLIDRG